MEEYILEIINLKKWFPIKKKIFGVSSEKEYVKAVDGIDLKVKEGETLGIVGESGCGKSTLGRTILKLIEPTDGNIIFQGKDITNLNEKEMKDVRRNMQIMFQDPYASLNPRMVVGDIIAEPMDIQKTYNSEKERLLRIVELMEVCGLNKSYINRYPHEFSGGQRQRIGIARALSLSPKVIICDEPVSALDVSIQSQVINLLMKLQEQYKLTLIFISHDLSVVHHISDRVAVMYLGKIVELSEKNDLYNNPGHPYTKALLQSIPTIGGDSLKTDKPLLEGDIPSPVNPPPGCAFHTRCPDVSDECKKVVPKLMETGNNHMISCIKVHSSESILI